MIRVGMCPNPFEESEWHRNANPILRWLGKAIEDHGAKIVPLTRKEAQHPLAWEKLNVDVVHFHWPGSVFDFYVSRIQFQKLLPQPFVINWAKNKLANWENEVKQVNIPIVWQVHDILSHHTVGYNAPADLMLHRTIFNNSDGLVLNGNGSLQPVIDYYGQEKPYAVAALGSYRALYGAPISKAEARKRLGIHNTGKIFSYLGTARPNRNPVDTAKVFPEVTNENDILIIAGIDNQVYLPDRLDVKIKLYPGIVPPQLFHEILCASDFVINDGKKYLTSAILRAAASYHIPVIAYAYGCANDFAKDAAVWIDDAHGGLEEAIRHASEMDEIGWNKLSAAASYNEKAMTWNLAGAECVALYEKVIENRKGK